MIIDLGKRLLMEVVGLLSSTYVSACEALSVWDLTPDIGCRVLVLIL